MLPGRRLWPGTRWWVRPAGQRPAVGPGPGSAASPPAVPSLLDTTWNTQGKSGNSGRRRGWRPGIPRCGGFSRAGPRHAEAWPAPRSRLAGAMPAGGRALLALGLLALGCAAARPPLPPPAAGNDFPEGAPERRRPPGPAPGCPRDCGCTQEGVVDCGGIDLKEFPLQLPELTNHLSLQVREPTPPGTARLPPAPRGLPGPCRPVSLTPPERGSCPLPSAALQLHLGSRRCSRPSACPWQPCLVIRVDWLPTDPGRGKDGKTHPYSLPAPREEFLSKLIITVSAESLSFWGV